MGMDLQSVYSSVVDKVEESIPVINGFEGVEKRLEVGFSPLINSKPDGLRRLSHQQINDLLKLAECTIVSKLYSRVFDSYVLSESSLFIYPYKIILKTCGRTQLLKCIPLLLNYAISLSLEPCFCKYTHGTFIFPLSQPFPYTSFVDEAKYLDTFFGHMESQAYTMGNEGHPCWHIYSAATHTPHESTYTLEMGMTHLDKDFTSIFFNDTGSKTGQEMTEESCIDKILPNSSICDYAFAPCGYSMNGVDEGAVSTIHITPEDTHSYGSFEAMGYNSQSLNLQGLVDCVISIFKPVKFVMSVHVSGTCSDDHITSVNGKVKDSWGSSLMPLGYVCDFTQREVLPGGSFVTFHSFCKSKLNQVKSREEMKQLIIPRPLLPFCGGAEEAGEARCLHM